MLLAGRRCHCRGRAWRCQRCNQHVHPKHPKAGHHHSHWIGAPKSPWRHAAGLLLLFSMRLVASTASWPCRTRRDAQRSVSAEYASTLAPFTALPGVCSGNALAKALAPALLASSPHLHLLTCAKTTLQEIAAAKAGICKQGRPALIARQPEPDALAKLEQCAQSAGCPVLKPQHTLKLQVCICAPQMSPSALCPVCRQGPQLCAIHHCLSVCSTRP